MNKKPNTVHPRELEGTWLVRDGGTKNMISPIDWIGDKKVVNCEAGYNILKGKKWGFFSVFAEGDELILNYDDPRNLYALQHVIDRIHRDGVAWEGVLYLFDREQFKFRLERA